MVSSGDSRSDSTRDGCTQGKVVMIFKSTFLFGINWIDHICYLQTSLNNDMEKRKALSVLFVKNVFLLL